MSEPRQKIICGTCRGDGREVSFTGAELDCQSCGGVGSHYEAPNKIRDLKDDIASLRAECDRLTIANTSLQNQLDHAEKVYRANSQSYRDEIAELSAAIKSTVASHGQQSNPVASQKSGNLQVNDTTGTGGAYPGGNHDT